MQSAHHMVPTPLVTCTANHELNRAIVLPCGSWPATVTGLSMLPSSFSLVRRCGM